jgi:hypothetical protein
MDIDMETSAAATENIPAPPPAPRMAWQLPGEHLFRLVYSAYDMSVLLQNGGVHNDAAFNDLRRPVDWAAVESRLASHPAEAKEWIGTDCCARTSFLHQFASFNFGVTPNAANNILPIVSIDGETALRIMNQAIEIYPEALNLYNGNGCLPIHLVCHRHLPLGNGSICYLTWTLTTERIVHLMYRKCPTSFSQSTLTSSQTALSLLLASHDPSEGTQNRSRVIDFLLDNFPEACRIPDVDGRYPLHTAAHSYYTLEVMQKLLSLYPQAAEIKSTVGTTPLLAILRCQFGNSSYEIPSLLLDACPWSAAMDDEKVLMMVQGHVLEPSGDAFDYLCLNYCELVRVHFTFDDLAVVDDITLDEDFIEYRKGYIKANINFITSPLLEREHDFGSLWGFLLYVLRTMYGGGRELFSPLHAAVHGRLCRPWNLVVLDGIVKRHPDDAKKRIARGNLPIHSFLSSCLVEQERAISRYYAGDADDYAVAVKHALRLILAAYPEGSRLTSGNGRLPIHLAIDTSRSFLAYDVLVEQILEHAPGTLLKRDAATGSSSASLHPFAAAAIGGRADLDLTFQLLRRDPSALADALVGARKRKRTIA